MRTKRIGERRVLLEVADNGPGVPQGILARIFDPFFTTKPAGVGTGLGLAIVLSVVREHGGKVNVLSPPQGGAVFQIELPAAAETADAAAGPPFSGWRDLLPKAAEIAARANKFESGREHGNGARVLVVEDEPTVARLIADVLKDEGMQVDVLMDGREALERAAHTRESLERHHIPHVAKPFRMEFLGTRSSCLRRFTGRMMAGFLAAENSGWKRLRHWRCVCAKRCAG